jgi:hypothetical protein
MRGGHDGYSISEIWPHKTTVIPPSRKLRAKFIESCRRKAIQKAKQWWTEIKDGEARMMMAYRNTPETTPMATDSKRFSRRWMLDSGASVNMIRTSDLSKAEKAHIAPLENPCRLVTANGVI